MSKKEQKLSALGRKAEAILKRTLEEIDEERKKAAKEKTEPKYSLTDLFKVMDRALKLEGIRARVAVDDEGSFFKSKGAADEPE